jgi:hypothetical protein
VSEFTAVTLLPLLCRTGKGVPGRKQGGEEQPVLNASSPYPSNEDILVSPLLYQFHVNSNSHFSS